MTQSEEATVSIVVTNFNGESFLPKCLDSLLDQSYGDLEILVADNASTDGSHALVETKYPDARLVRLKDNRGFAAAVNAGIKEAVGDFVVIMNNDTVAERDFVKELHSALSRESSAAMAAPKMLFARAPETINSMGLGYSITGTNHDIGFGVDDDPRLESHNWIFGPCGGAGMYRKQVFEDAGFFDEDFFMYYEDVDYCFRAQLAGQKCVSAPAARIYHAEGASGGALPKSRNYYFARNSLRVILKNFPRRLLLKYSHVIAWEIVKRTFSPLLKGDASALVGYVAALGGIRKTVKKRREVQQRKRVPDRYIEGILVRNRSILKEINLGGRPVGELR